MSGHSKWSKIKRQKAAGDAKRGTMFTKLGRSITLAVKESGGVTDIESNNKLRIAIDQAKQFNMPKENIQRAIERGAGKGEGLESLERVIYEGYGPHGIALIIEAVTDNKQRTSSQVKFVLSRTGGSLGSQGSVVFQFSHQGYIHVAPPAAGEDALLEMVIECGGLDMEPEEDGEFGIYTDRTELHKVKDALEKRDVTVLNAELVYRPTVTVPITEDEAHSLISCIEQLEDLDDIHKVYANDAIAA